MIPTIRLTAENVTLRLMEPDDLPAIHEIYRSNVPEFLPEDFDPMEEVNEESPNYFVAESSGRLVGGAGINLGQTGEQSLLYLACVHPDFHRKGIGSLLLLARLAWTEGDPGVAWAVVPTRVQGFYQRFGFEPVEVPKGRQATPGFTRMGRWIYPGDRSEIQDALRSLPIRDLTGPEGISEEVEEE